MFFLTSRVNTTPQRVFSAHKFCSIESHVPPTKAAWISDTTTRTPRNTTTKNQSLAWGSSIPLVVPPQSPNRLEPWSILSAWIARQRRCIFGSSLTSPQPRLLAHLVRRTLWICRIPRHHLRRPCARNMVLLFFSPFWSEVSPCLLFSPFTAFRFLAEKKALQLAVHALPPTQCTNSTSNYEVGNWNFSKDFPFISLYRKSPRDPVSSNYQPR